MKRFVALLLALLMALGTASAQEAEMTGQGVTVVRNHVEETVGRQQIVVDYPTFSCEDAQLELYLTDQITAPIQALQRREERLRGLLRLGLRLLLILRGRYRYIRGGVLVEPCPYLLPRGICLGIFKPLLVRVR